MTTATRQHLHRTFARHDVNPYFRAHTKHISNRWEEAPWPVLQYEILSSYACHSDSHLSHAPNENVGTPASSQPLLCPCLYVGAQIENIFNPIRGPRDAQVRAGVKPVNHSRNNILAMKEQSQMNALQKHQEAQQQQSPGQCDPGERRMCIQWSSSRTRH